MYDTIVTGASGFLGSHLVKRLDNPTTIPHSQISSFNLNAFNTFYFLSTYGNMVSHKEDDKIIQANLLDLISILKQIDFQTGFKSFVYISSSSVRLAKQTTYSRAKRAAEEILLSYIDKYNAPICIIRPFSITGVGEQKEHLIPTLIRSCLYGTPMDFAPKPVHDFIDVEDVVDGILNLSNHKARGVFELGTGNAYTNQEVRKIVESVTGYPANCDDIDKLREYDNPDWVSNNYKSRMYGWSPKKTLPETVEEMVKEVKNAVK